MCDRTCSLTRLKVSGPDCRRSCMVMEWARFWQPGACLAQRGICWQGDAAGVALEQKKRRNRKQRFRENQVGRRGRAPAAGQLLPDQQAAHARMFRRSGPLLVACSAPGAGLHRLLSLPASICKLLRKRQGEACIQGAEHSRTDRAWCRSGRSSRRQSPSPRSGS